MIVSHTIEIIDSMAKGLLWISTLIVKERQKQIELYAILAMSRSFDIRLARELSINWWGNAFSVTVKVNFHSLRCLVFQYERSRQLQRHMRCAIASNGTAISMAHGRRMNICYCGKHYFDLAIDRIWCVKQTSQPCSNMIAPVLLPMSFCYWIRSTTILFPIH